MLISSCFRLVLRFFLDLPGWNYGSSYIPARLIHRQIRSFCIRSFCYIARSKNTAKIRTREIYIGNPEKHEIGSGTKLLFTFLSLRFFDMRKERHNFFNKCAAHFADSNWSRRGEAKNRLPSSRLESQLSRSEFISQLTGFFFFRFQNSQRFQAWRHSCTRSYFLSGVFIVTSLIVTSTRTRVNTCTQWVHLTNPCTKLKGSQPN